MRKHHNKLYYGKYRYKIIFDMQSAALLWPTTEEHLTEFKNKNPKPTKNNLDMIWDVADFIIQNRGKMKFRIQEKKSIFYSNKELAFELKTKFIDHFVNMEIVDPRHGDLKENIVGCHRLPHGKYQYQVHIKKDAHRIITNLQRENLKDFIERNIDNCFVPSYALMDYLEDKCPYCFGGYFYVTQERYITPIYMMAQEAIDKVIQFRKVKNGSNKKTER
jgi:hypothetical protein